MTVKKSAPASRPKAPSTPSAGEAWQAVMARVSDLGDAMAKWTQAAVHEADSKEKLDEVRAGINDIAHKADAAFGRAEGELGHQVKESAEQASQAFGDAAQRVREATEPHVKNAFADLSDIFGKAAARIGEPTPERPKPSSTPAKPRTPKKA